MKRRSIGTCGLIGIGLAALAQHAVADVLVQYNFGSVSTTGELLGTFETPTTMAPNTGSNNLTLGGTTATALDEGSAVASYYTSPGPNYLSVNNSSANSDSGFYVDFVVTANAGYTITPSSFTIVGGAGGSSNTRSFLLFDSADGLPSSIAATAATPTATGGSQVGSTTAFTAVRSTGVAMNSFTVPFSASDANLSSFEVRVYFDTQLNGQAKNIDLGSLTLNGSVAATPEPGTLGLAGLGLLALARRRK